MPQRWRIHPHDQALVAAIEKSVGASPVVAQLLAARGVHNADDARIFLEAKLTGLRDPELLPGVTEAAARIDQAVRAERRIVIYGDYDCDGMTAAAILVSCLREIGANVGSFTPNRLEDGYGLNDRALEELAKRGASLVITVDCGIASVAEAATARRLGLELIITDHHQYGPELPDAAVLVHPALPGSDYPFPGLCGAGVAFKLAWAICQQASQAKKVNDKLREFLLGAIALAAVGTVADVVPLIDENRILVRHGLHSLSSRPNIGLTALMKVVELDKKPALTSDDIGFRLAPRLNAAGRFGQAALGVELLTTRSAERAEALAEYIHDLNRQRDSLEQSILLQASKQIKEEFDAENDRAFVLAGRDWHSGVIGIVAGRLAEKYHRPVVLLSLDKLGQKAASGSARAGGRLNLHDALEACSTYLVTHGGHAAAAGLSLEEANIDAFRAEFCEHVAGILTSADMGGELAIDAEAPLAQFNLPTVDQIEQQLAPFGQGNRRPLFCTRGVELAETPRRMGGGDRHLQAKFRQHGQTMRAVAFGKGDWADELAECNGPIDIAFHPVINDFRGRRVEMHLVDWRPSE
ncbi:single-stranded-DNA-specific exonuclease RecJ [Lignipirellula cremea]|uniref:Single-stranded-DNA-specific exonuclease RecJ n=1 Tax=Lignipirellula cremea TaxID=2528010 RepID=A0A518E1C4_9BACT|nr:single-stranded-DNA-specific exonuclease RecJ [Lignipirellula cremea]QDU97864.1 Single-stranded-DNA-specific exonuclease RecJ [Lignipirellula cremea]